MFGKGIGKFNRALFPETVVLQGQPLEGGFQSLRQQLLPRDQRLHALPARINYRVRVTALVTTTAQVPRVTSRLVPCMLPAAP